MAYETRPGPQRKGYPVPPEFKANNVGVSPETTTGPQYTELEREKDKFQGKDEAVKKKGQIWPDPDMLANPLKVFPNFKFPSRVKLFHGTVSPGKFIPDGPASFSTNPKHAEFYAQTEHEGAPATLEFSTKDIPRVIDIPQKDMRSATYWLNRLVDDNSGGGRGPFNALGMGRLGKEAWSIVKKAGYDGLYIRKINSGGDELVVFEPEKFLKVIGRTEHEPKEMTTDGKSIEYMDDLPESRLVEANVTTLAQMYKVPVKFAELVNNYDRQNADLLLQVVQYTAREQIKQRMSGVKSSDDSTIDVWKDVWELCGGLVYDICQFIKKNPSKKQIFKSMSLNTPAFDYRDVLRSMRDKDAILKFPQKMQDASVLKLADGSFWSKLEKEDWSIVAQDMDHCGQPVLHNSDLYQLFDKEGKPHVTLELNTANSGQLPGVQQIKGKQNKFPGKKYWTAVHEFIKKFKATNAEELTPAEFRNHKSNEGKSIKHLDDLPESRFLPTLKALAEGRLEITEKLDGSARMTFGVENGKIWTQSKSGPRRYESKAYPNQAKFKALRMAHEALESNSHGVIGAWPSGVSEMVSEVLYTKVPNTIEYGPNAIVVHRVNWKNEALLWPPRVPEKICVETIKLKEWRLDYRPDVKFDLAPFRVLHANVGILPLSFIQSETRKQILKAMQEMTSAYGTKKGLIEGVVLRDVRTGDMTKVVDRQLFTRLNQFFWRFRESLERGTMIEGKWQTGVMAAFRKRLAEDILQATGLRNPKLIEVVKKNKKSTLDETLLAMIPNKKFPLLDFDNTVSEGTTQLNRLMIDWRLHLAMQPSLVLVSEDGSYSRTVSMHELVIERTEAAFADAVEYFESMSRIGTNIKENPARLVMVAKVVMGPNVVEKLEKLFEAEVHPGDWPDTKQHHAPEKMGVKIPSNTQKPEKPAEMKSKIDAVLKSHIELLKKRGIQTHGEHVGQGSFGVAFDANFKGKNVVLKITSDKSEANASNHIIGKKLKHIVHIYDVFKFKDTIYYGVLQEKLQKLHESEKDNFNTLVFIMQKAKVGPELIKGDIDAALDKVEKTFADKPNTIKFFAQAVVSFDFDKIIEELASNGIQFIDYHGGNLMKRGEDFVLIDLGMSRVPNTNIPILETIMRLLTEKAAARVGVTLGRFQPFHKGHAAIIRDLCKKYTRVIVLVAGNKRDKKNPFSYELRLEMMKNSLPDVFSKIEVHKAEFEGKSSGYIPGILSDISINKKSSIQGDTAFEILVGDDRVQEIQKQMDHARQSKMRGTQLYFDPDMVIVKTLPGVKNDDEAGRVSGTSLRAAILKGDKESAKKLVDPHLVSNPADFESLYVRMEKELKGDNIATVESVVNRIVEGLAQIGGEVAIQKVLKDNAKLLKHKNIDVRSLRKLGEGDNGIVYSIGNNKALKVTSDIEQDAETCMHLMNKHQENVVHIFDVFKFPNAPMAGIIEEELKPLSKDEITEFDDMRKTVLALFGQSDKEQGEFTKAMELGDFDKFRKKLEIFLAKEIRLNLQYPAGSQINPNKEQRLKDTLSKGMTRYSNVLVKYNVPNIMKDLKKMGIKFSDYHGTNIMKRGNEYVIADLGGAASASIKIPVLEMVNVVVSDIVNELGIFTGNSDTTVGARAGSSQWSKGRQLDASSGSLDGQWQNQLKGFPKLR